MNSNLVTFRFFKLTLGSLFKIGFICNLFVWGVLAIVVGVAALFGADTVTVGGDPVTGAGGEPLTGLPGLLFALALGLGFSLIGAVILMLGGLTARVVNRWVSFGGVSYRDS